MNRLRPVLKITGDKWRYAASGAAEVFRFFLLITVVSSAVIRVELLRALEVPVYNENECMKSYFRVSFDFFYLNNGDFRNYSHSVYADRKVLPAVNSDDALSYVTADIEFGFYKKTGHSEMNLNLCKSGYFGNDNLENADEALNPLRVHEADVAYTSDSGFICRIGRMPYSIGGSVHEYFFNDTIDGIAAEYTAVPGIYPLGVSLTVDVLSNSFKGEAVRSGSTVNSDEERIDDFQGDTRSWRTGCVFSLVYVKTFHYYLRYGANTKGGADISENGKSAVNEADHDFITLHGLRLFYNFPFFSTDFTAAWSYGHDYQYSGRHTYNGFAGAADFRLRLGNDGMSVVPGSCLDLSCGFFQPEYCSMKASSPAGIALFSVKSYYLSPYAGAYHFIDGQKDPRSVSDYDSTVPKGFMKSAFLFSSDTIDWTLSHLVLFANENTDSVISNVPGTDEKGRGIFLFMGNEICAELSIKIDRFQINTGAGVFIPSDYYKIRSQFNTGFPDGTDPLYVFRLGVSCFMPVINRTENLY